MSLSAWYCRHHQAWHFIGYACEQNGEETQTFYWDQEALGPFDTLDEVARAFDRLRDATSLRL